MDVNMSIRLMLNFYNNINRVYRNTILHIYFWTFFCSPRKQLKSCCASAQIRAKTKFSETKGTTNYLCYIQHHCHLQLYMIYYNILQYAIYNCIQYNCPPYGPFGISQLSWSSMNTIQYIYNNALLHHIEHNQIDLLFFRFAVLVTDVTNT